MDGRGCFVAPLPPHACWPCPGRQRAESKSCGCTALHPGEVRVLESTARGAELCRASRGQTSQQAGPRDTCMALLGAEGQAGWHQGGGACHGEAAEPRRWAPPPLPAWAPPWHRLQQPGWHWVQRAWESRVEEALVPSKKFTSEGM